MAVELCAGCGAATEDGQKHPMAGVTRNEVTHQMQEYPVCLECWTNPAHRKNALKMHFFDRRTAPQAVQDAQNNILVSPA
jgi:hypothetical protein